MNKSLLLLNSLILFSFLNVISQNVEFEKSKFPGRTNELNEAKENISQADKMLEKNTLQVKDALELYLKANSFNPQNAMLNYKIGVCYLNTFDKVKAIPYLEKAYSIKKDAASGIIYQLAEAYHYNLEFAKAIDKYKEAKENLTAKEKWDEKKGELMDRKVFECQSGIQILKNKIRCNIENTGNIINSSLNEFNPLVNADATVLVFTVSKTPYSPLPSPNTEANIFISTKINGQWSVPINAGKTLNYTTDNEAVGISPDGLKLLLCYDNGKYGKDLYESSFNGSEWSKPYNLGDKINTKSNEIAACYSPDGNSIYFVSDKPGGSGGYDIYASAKVAGRKHEWGVPVSLGPVINSKYDEIAVFMDFDGKTLYFTSNGHTTMGGFDIFKSVKTEKGWSEPENIGYPVNTPQNETIISFTAKGKIAYYSMPNPKDNGNTDIYTLTFPGPDKQIIYNTETNLLVNNAETFKDPVTELAVDNYSKHVTLLTGTITDENNSEPLQVTIEVTDITKNLHYATVESNGKTGKYLVVLPSGANYSISYTAENYLFGSCSINIPDSTLYRQTVKDKKLVKIAPEAKTVLNCIFFYPDRNTLQQESFSELDNLAIYLKDFSKLKLEISGYAMSKDKDENSKNLSEDRAKTVVDYLISKGIEQKRLTYKGYGSEQPATSSTQANRVELKVIGN